MPTENWEGEAAATNIVADLPEIKLFGRWSSSDVVVSDISLTVSILTENLPLYSANLTKSLPSLYLD